jgi:hypothetical protein
MTDLDAQAAYITEAQQACRKAKDSRDTRDLEAARLVLSDDRLQGLPKKAILDLQWAYASAVMSVTGGGAA